MSKPAPDSNIPSERVRRLCRSFEELTRGLSSSGDSYYAAALNHFAGAVCVMGEDHPEHEAVRRFAENNLSKGRSEVERVASSADAVKPKARTVFVVVKEHSHGPTIKVASTREIANRIRREAARDGFDDLGWDIPEPFTDADAGRYFQAGYSVYIETTRLVAEI